MIDRSMRHAQTRDSRIAIAVTALLISFAVAATLGNALPAALGLTVALWQAMRTPQAEPATAPIRARAPRARR